MKEEQLAKAVAAVVETEAGVIFFREMARTCGFHIGDIVVSPVNGLVDPVATTVNVERRRVYLHFRRLIPAEALSKIEIVSSPEETKVVKTEEKI